MVAENAIFDQFAKAWFKIQAKLYSVRNRGLFFKKPLVHKDLEYGFKFLALLGSNILNRAKGKYNKVKNIARFTSSLIFIK
jgi:hypothetical protein